MPTRRPARCVRPPGAPGRPGHRPDTYGWRLASRSTSTWRSCRDLEQRRAGAALSPTPPRAGRPGPARAARRRRPREGPGLLQPVGLLPAPHRRPGRPGEVAVDGDHPVGVVAEGDQVLLQLAHVGAVVDPRRQGPPGWQPAVEQRHRLAVDPVQGLAAGDHRPLGGQGGDGALALVGDRRGLAVPRVPSTSSWARRVRLATSAVVVATRAFALAAGLAAGPPAPVHQAAPAQHHPAAAATASLRVRRALTAGLPGPPAGRGQLGGDRRPSWPAGTPPTRGRGRPGPGA